MDKESLTPLKIAQEELREETSFKPKRWEKFYVYEMPGATIEEKVDYFIAQSAKQTL